MVGGVDWRALDLKEAAQALWRRGYLEEALPLAQESARLREDSSLICLSLSELGCIYLEMLKIDEAEQTARRMLREAHRYDTLRQTRLAKAILADAEEERRHGFYYGNMVTLNGLANVEMNGQLGEIRGRVWPQTPSNPDRYRVLVGSRILSIRRGNIILADVDIPGEAAIDGHADHDRIASDRGVKDSPAVDKLQDPLFGASIKRTIGGLVRKGLVEDIEVDKFSGVRLYCIKYDDGDIQHVNADMVKQWMVETTAENPFNETCKRCGVGPLDMAEQVRRCAVCLKTLHYCSEDCARQGWKSHRRACKRAIKKAAAHCA